MLEDSIRHKVVMVLIRCWMGEYEYRQYTHYKKYTTACRKYPTVTTSNQLCHLNKTNTDKTESCTHYFCDFTASQHGVRTWHWKLFDIMWLSWTIIYEVRLQEFTRECQGCICMYGPVQPSLLWTRAETSMETCCWSPCVFISNIEMCWTENYIELILCLVFVPSNLFSSKMLWPQKWCQ